MKKSKPKHNFIESGIVIFTKTELTIDDIKNNLRKTTFKDYNDQTNLYEFLHTASTSCGKSGFVTIKKPEKRKNSCESPKIAIFNSKEFSRSPRNKGKSHLNSPVFASTQISSQKNLENFSALGKIVKAKGKKKSHSKQVKKKKLKLRKNSARDKEMTLKMSPKAKKGEETTREKFKSPYSVLPCNSLPSLHNFKRKIDLISTIKLRKKSKQSNH